MILREFRKADQKAVEEIFALYWTDLQFLERLSQRLDIFINQTPEAVEQQYRFFVAEEGDEIIGVAGFRRAPDHMKEYTITEHPAEFYIIASKYKERGIGEALRLKRLEEAKRLGFTEVVLYSPNSHKDSWSFHDRLGFERVGEALAPDGEPGMIWRKIL